MEVDGWKLTKQLTCATRFLTATAGGGSPCDEVALCTPPEMGVRKSPALPALVGLAGLAGPPCLIGGGLGTPEEPTS